VRGTSWTGPHSASFPCGTALGATFDPAIVEEVGQALAREARSKGAHVLLAPTVNLHRTPIGGRNFECMSEDPLLTAQLAVAYITGLQGEGVAACIKHFVANDTEFERMTISSEVDERTLRELYLVPFEAAVRPAEQGGADVRCVMSSYNRVNGTYASEHHELLRGVLRDEWGFDGVVVSDWYGTHSGIASLEASLDLEMPGPARHRDARLVDAVRSGALAEHLVDESVRRLLQLMAWCRVGETPGDEVTDDAPTTRDVIRRAGLAATVLLKNEGAQLPLASASTIALVGPNAERGQVQGGGSARVRAHRPVPILAALRDRGLDVTFEQGCSIAKRLPPLRGEFEAVYTGPDGATVATPVERLQLVFLDPPAPGVDQARFGVTVSGTFVPETGGDWQFGLVAVGPATLHVDGQLVCDLSQPQSGGTFFGRSSPEVRGVVSLEAGVPCSVVLGQPYLDDPLPRALMVGAAPVDTESGIERAVAAAADADVAVVVVGTNDDWETEGEDREDMVLPGLQDELVSRVAAANPRTVVVVNAGSPVAMPWLDEVAAVVQVWFPGEEIGNVVADVLLGLDEPGGRLPMSIPRALIDTPAAASHPGKNGVAPYDEGVFIGYRWYDAKGIESVFPFGHGLGYTTWALGAPALAGAVGEGVVVRVPVTNTGARPGSTVVQCYVEPPADDDRPVRTLAAFAKVHVAPGDETVVELRLSERAFSTWDVEQHTWRVIAGAHRIHLGWSSRDLHPAGSVVAR
jgi:beta-glucosidase